MAEGRPDSRPDGRPGVASLGALAAPSLGGRRLIVRSDASRSSGTGHLMRAFALAQAWLRRGGAVRWLLAEAPEALAGRIAGAGVEIVRIAVDPAGWADAAAMHHELLADGSAIGVLDGLEFADRYLAGLEGVGGQVLLVDDAAERGAYPVGAVLNQNAHADRDDYPRDATARFLLGTDYVLLRPEFIDEPPPRTIPVRAGHLLVTFGGADPRRVTGRVVAALADLPEDLRAAATVQVLVGAANADRAEHEAEARRLAGRLEVEILQSVMDMPALLAVADLAITSGGTTVWELARMGCPALVVETVPVESLLARGLARVGLNDLLGNLDDLDGATITAAVAARMVDAAWRRDTSALGRRLVDGKGADRVIDVLASDMAAPG